MTPSEIAREILNAFGNRPDAAYSIEADLWLFERIKTALSEQRQAGLESVKCDICGSNDIGVCVDCHCKSMDLVRQEGYNAGVEAARKETPCNCGSKNCLVNIHGVETPICSRPGHHAPFCGCGQESKK